MAVPPRRDIPGLKNIPTYSTSFVQKSDPSKIYLKLGQLGNEEKHKKRARENAISQVENADDRLQKIKAEKKKLLQILGDINVDSDDPSDTSDIKPKPKPRNSKDARGFRLRY